MADKQPGIYTTQTQYLLACLASILTIHKWVHTCNYFPGQCSKLHKQTTGDESGSKTTMNFNKAHHRINRTSIQAMLTVAPAPLGYILFTHFCTATPQYSFLQKKCKFQYAYHFRLSRAYNYVICVNVYSSSSNQHNSVIQFAKPFRSLVSCIQLARSKLAGKNCHKTGCDGITPIKQIWNYTASSYKISMFLSYCW